jgi:hypothetical protein
VFSAQLTTCSVPASEDHESTRWTTGTATATTSAFVVDSAPPSRVNGPPTAPAGAPGFGVGLTVVALLGAALVDRYRA